MSPEETEVGVWGWNFYETLLYFTLKDLSQIGLLYRILDRPLSVVMVFTHILVDKKKKSPLVLNILRGSCWLVSHVLILDQESRWYYLSGAHLTFTGDLPYCYVKTTSGTLPRLRTARLYRSGRSMCLRGVMDTKLTWPLKTSLTGFGSKFRRLPSWSSRKGWREVRR